MRALFFPSTYNLQPKRSFRMMLRQGLPPIEDPTLTMRERYYNVGYRYGLKVSPDLTKGVHFHNSSSSNVNFCGYFTVGPNGWSSDTNPAAAYSGYVIDCFTSNDYYGWVGYSTSFINAFRWSDHSLVTLNKTGLGTVYRCSISPNGYSLAVVHATAPYLRVYDLRDGSFVNPVTAPAGAYNLVSWTGNGNSLIVVSNTTPFVMKYDPALTTRTTISTASTYATNTSYLDNVGQSYGPYSLPHPTKPDCALISSNSLSSSRGLFEVNAATNSIIDIITLDNSNARAILGTAYDTVENTLYVHTLTQNTLCLTAYDATTYAPKPSLDATSVVMGYAEESRPLVIINKNYGQITGTVRDVNNNPVARQVRVFRRSDGLLVGQTTSNATTGDYSVLTPDATPEGYDVQFYTATGELLNDLIYARVTPTLIP